VKRNYLNEAMRIYEGADIPVRKEHVKAVVDMLLALGKNTESLRQKFREFCLQSVVKRKQVGLPPLELVRK
jgi:hypothetical protein